MRESGVKGMIFSVYLCLPKLNFYYPAISLLVPLSIHLSTWHLVHPYPSIHPFNAPTHLSTSACLSVCPSVLLTDQTICNQPNNQAITNQPIKNCPIKRNQTTDKALIQKFHNTILLSYIVLY